MIFYSTSEMNNQIYCIRLTNSMQSMSNPEIKYLDFQKTFEKKFTEKKVEAHGI